MGRGLERFRLTLGNLLLRSGGVNTQHTPEAPDLAQEVRDLLDCHRGQWKAIAAATDVSHSWLSKYARGKILNPGYATLRRLQSHLKDIPAPQRTASRLPASSSAASAVASID
jgi:transcriptional regulator with XRE-family HTH domain